MLLLRKVLFSTALLFAVGMPLFLWRSQYVAQTALEWKLFWLRAMSG